MVTQASKVHPIHAHMHYDFLTKGTRRLSIANSLYIVDASEFALDPFQLDIIVHKSDFVPSLVLNIISYLKENFQEPITLDFLSKKFSVSKATLIYNFNKYLRSSPVDYLINIRIQHAKDLLTNTNSNLSEIAEQCGFSNANYDVQTQSGYVPRQLPKIPTAKTKGL